MKTDQNKQRTIKNNRCEEDMNKRNARLFADMHIKNLKEIKYRHNRAIEYAMHKLGMTWDDNRQRLSFYEYFEESLQNEPKHL